MTSWYQYPLSCSFIDLSYSYSGFSYVIFLDQLDKTWHWQTIEKALAHLCPSLALLPSQCEHSQVSPLVDETCSAEPSQPHFPSQSLWHVTKRSRPPDLLLLATSSTPFQTIRAISHRLQVEVNTYGCMPPRLWGYLLHSIFVAIGNWYMKVVWSRNLKLIKCRTIEFKISLKIHQYKIIL